MQYGRLAAGLLVLPALPTKPLHFGAWLGNTAVTVKGLQQI